MRWTAVAGVVLAAFALAGCRNDNAEKPTPTPTATIVPASESPTTPAPTKTPVPGRIDVPSVVKLIDVRTGTVKTLHEDRVNAAWDASFSGDSVVVRVGPGVLQFRMDGTAIVGSEPVECRKTGSSAEIAGKTFPGIACGTLSPDRLWMTYRVDAPEVTLPSGQRVPTWDQWLLNVKNGETSLIQAGLAHCGGCDGRYGPRWAPNSRHVVYAEIGGQQRRFLTEASTVTTRTIGTGAEVPLAPAWSPDGTVLAYSSKAGSPTTVEDLASGTSREFALAWPVAFDLSGTLVYSPAWSPSLKAENLTTTMANLASGAIVARLDGAPPSWFTPLPATVVDASAPGGLLVVLQQAPGCAGTAVYRSGALTQCISGGVAAELGRGGGIAVARKTGAVGPAYGPGFETVSIDQFDVDLVGTGSQPRNLVNGAISFQSPLMVWNAAGTHLIVLWPRSIGL